MPKLRIRRDDPAPRGRHPGDPTGEMFGDRHWPFPNRWDRERLVPYIAIHRKKLRFLVRSDYTTTWNIALRKTRNRPKRIVIGPSGDNRTYSKFSREELEQLYFNHTGYSYAGDNYGALVQACRALGETIKLKKPAGYREPPAPIVEEKKPEKKRPPRKVVRPKKGTVTGRVWKIADRVAAKNPDAGEKELRTKIIERCVEKGINQSTAQTQYSKWKTAKK